MKLKEKRLLVFSIFLLVFFIVPAVSAHSNLVGKYGHINGPYCWDYLGLARTDRAYQFMEEALDDYDQEFFQALLKFNYDIIVVEKNAPVIVLDVRRFENRAKVTVLGGLQQGATGWIPLNWIENSQKSAKLWQ